MTLYADYSAAHLAGTALKNAGFAGAIRYVGTPGRTKNATASEVQSLQNAGLDVRGVYENSTSDFTGGNLAGQVNAHKAISDAKDCGMWPCVIFMSADQHLSASQLTTWKAYLQGALTVLTGLCGAYGFSEAIQVAKDLGITQRWGAGSRSEVAAVGYTFYQRNSGTTTKVVSGITVDCNEYNATNDSFVIPAKGASMTAAFNDRLAARIDRVCELLLPGNQPDGFEAHPQGTYSRILIELDAVPENQAAMKAELDTIKGSVATVDSHTSDQLAVISAKEDAIKAALPTAGATLSPDQLTTLGSALAATVVPALPQGLTAEQAGAAFTAALRAEEQRIAGL